MTSQIQSSTNEAGLKKRHQDAIALLMAQLEAANQYKLKWVLLGVFQGFYEGFLGVLGVSSTKANP